MRKGNLGIVKRSVFLLKTLENSWSATCAATTDRGVVVVISYHGGGRKKEIRSLTSHLVPLSPKFASVDTGDRTTCRRRDNVDTRPSA